MAEKPILSINMIAFVAQSLRALAEKPGRYQAWARQRLEAFEAGRPLTESDEREVVIAQETSGAPMRAQPVAMTTEDAEASARSLASARLDVKRAPYPHLTATGSRRG